MDSEADPDRGSYILSKKSKGTVKRPIASAEALRHNPFAALAEAKASHATAPGSDRDTNDAAVARGAVAREEIPPLSDGAAPSSASAGPYAGKLVVQTERKGRAGKTVTRISGVAAANVESVARRMKHALGCGAIVEGDQIILLGAVADRALRWLRSEGARRVVKGN